jgi:hypothetical protein
MQAPELPCRLEPLTQMTASSSAVKIGRQVVGAVAQLGERRVRNAKVGSSILLGSTNKPDEPGKARLVVFSRHAPVAQQDRASAS